MNILSCDVPEAEAMQRAAIAPAEASVSPPASSRISRMIVGAKRSYVTRRVDLASIDALVLPPYTPKAGDIALCSIIEIGQHAHLELVTGRRAQLFVDDLVVVAFGERYATDQFHACLPSSLDDCALVAAGGIAAGVVDKHARMKRATRIRPVGVLADASGAALNVASGALKAAPHRMMRKPVVVTVLGSSMNAGKTTTAATIIAGLKSQNAKVGAMKLTGTGSGGDCWAFRDAGADPVLDFTDAGFASTYNVSVGEIERAGALLMDQLTAAGVDFIVCEVADGLLQQETAALIDAAFLRRVTDSVIFAASDPISAAAGVHMLSSRGYPMAAISGLVSASPLAAAEAARATGLRVLTLADLLAPDRSAVALLQTSRLESAAS